tara:strand:- start:1653 stop:2789 length:1137 start_codon:yes stop_codon:yes gene_type:complete
MCLSDPSCDSRPNRIIHLLLGLKISVDVASFPSSTKLPVGNFEFKEPSSTLTARIFRIFLVCLGSIFTRGHKYLSPLAERINELRIGLSTFDRQLLKRSYNIIVVEDLYLLPFAFRMKKDARIIFDAREYYPMQKEESLFFNLFNRPFVEYLCSNYLHRCNALFTVSSGLADRYMLEYNIEMKVLMSTPFMNQKLLPNPSKQFIRLVHHGAASKNRKIEKMIDVVCDLDDRFTLDFYLVGNKKYITKLQNYARFCDRIKFFDPVSFDQIVPMLNNYDIGFFYVEPSTFNLLNCLPNKFFEFIQARLAVAIGPSPNMAEFVNKYKCGFISNKFTTDSMIETLANLTPKQIDTAKANSHLAASELCWENESEKLIQVLNN